METPQIVQIVATISLLVVSLGIHEAAHAWVAFRCGDGTAKALGRLTINPVAHIDPFMTILLPLLLVVSGSPFLFGGAKPVPVNPHNLRHPMRDMMLVALAGPAANVVLACLFALAWKGLVYTDAYAPSALLPRVMGQAMTFNLVLAIFNMIPIPPLDGSRVMAWLLPVSVRETYVGLERFGMLIVFGLLFTGLFGTVIRGAMDPALDLVDFLTGGIW
jgi:Zn-dependent protease